MDTSTILHTLALQDRNAKRTREEHSCSNKDTTNRKFEIMHRKRTKLNPVNEQEEVIDIIDTDTEIKENALLVLKSSRSSTVLKSLLQVNQWTEK